MKCISCKGIKLKIVLKLVDVPSATQVISKDFLEKDRKVLSTIYICERCSLVQLPKEESLNNSYYEDYLIDRKYSSFSNDYQKALAKKFIADFNLKNKSILEIACGDGFFAELLKKEGAKVVGIEPSEEGYRSTRKRGIKVIKSYVDDEMKLSEKFEAFTACQILEHITEPQKFLKIISKFLLPDAFGLIEVPSFAKTFSEKRFNDFFPDHVAYYTPASLSYLLNSVGFRVIDIHESMNGEYISAIVQHVDKESNRLQNDFTDYRRKIKKFFREQKNKKIIAWGAGIRGISLLSYSGISPKLIRYCIDSDPSKHGLFLPGSHLEIVGPQILKNNNFDLVIITADLYTKEITSILRNKYKYNNKIAVLHPEPKYI